jgi:hypothetical protein
MIYILIFLGLNIVFAKLMVYYVFLLFDFAMKYYELYELVMPKKFLDQIVYYNNNRHFIRESYIPHVPILNILTVIVIIISLQFFKYKFK